MEDFSGLEYDQEHVCEEDVVIKTNGLLSHFNLPTQVASVRDITASLFVVLYESLFSDRLPGIVRQPLTKDDEINNCQMVIDVLSADVINDNLSHIHGTDIVQGKLQSISNLLDIFSFLYEYVIKQIESDIPTDTDDDVHYVDQQLPSGVQKLEMHLTDSVPDKGYFQSTSGGSDGSPSPFSKPAGFLGGAGHGDGSGAGNEAGYGVRGHEKMPISTPTARTRSSALPLSPVATAPSPIQLNATSFLMGHGTLDSTAELIQEGEQLERRFQEKRAFPPTRSVWEDTAATGRTEQFDFVGVRPVPTTVATYQRHDPPKTTTAAHTNVYPKTSVPVTPWGPALSGGSNPVYNHATLQPSRESNSYQNMSSAEPVPYVPRPSSTEQMNYPVRSLPYQGHQMTEILFQREPTIKGLSSSYGDLHNMVQQTAAMTRAAIDNSPMSHRNERDNLDITDLSRERQRIPKTEAHVLARELNQGSLLSHPYSAEPREIDRVALEANPYAVGDSTEIPTMGKESKHAGVYPDRAHKAVERIGVDLLDIEKIPPKIQTIPPNTDYTPLVRTGLRERVERKQLEKKQTTARSVPEPYKDTFTKERDVEREHTTKMKERYATVVDNIPSGSEVFEFHPKPRVKDMMADARRRRADGKDQVKLSTKLAEMGKPCLADVERQLETESRVYSGRQEYLQKLYDEEFGDVVEEVKNLMSKDQVLMDGMEEEYRKLMMIVGGGQTTAKKSKPAVEPKGYLLPSTKREKSVKVFKTPKKKPSVDLLPEVRARPLTIGKSEELMLLLLEEFPHLHMSDNTWHELWRRGIRQIENLTHAYEENKRHKSTAQFQLEEAARKHEVLAAIVKKQIDHNHKMSQIKDQKKQQVVLKNKLCDKRVQSARARRYYNEFQVRSRSRMLKRRSKEETIFRNLFKDGLAIQKERIHEVQRYAKDQREKLATKQQNEIDSLENYYRDQFELLVGKLMKDREEMKAREHAHHKVLETMKRDLRKKMDKEIVNIQNEMFRDDDDTYFRQLEADRMRQDLQVARYQTRV